VLDTDLEQMCADLCAMYQARYNSTANEVNVRAYNVGAPPNVPRANVTVDGGVVWPIAAIREQALCLSFAGANRGDKRRRGRIYLEPGISTSGVLVTTLRPNQAAMDWALGFYTVPNASFPDIGGPDWKFGIWSEVGQHFTQSTQAWCNDDWDIQRRRGLRESTRTSVVRDG
jgi:hypothetical protein